MKNIPGKKSKTRYRTNVSSLMSNMRQLDGSVQLMSDERIIELERSAKRAYEKGLRDIIAGFPDKKRKKTKPKKSKRPAKGNKFRHVNVDTLMIDQRIKENMPTPCSDPGFFRK
ncbi:MAG: hypothetical protein NTZ97_03890 [Candidatus Moranbacteria bacterium]|nr:hypothetical protein [Candidatus Moranbacteria bacterium]